MNYTHPVVVRIEKEHNYARPWHKKINATQKYPCRLTRFLYLRNFPRHFLSKYPHAFSSKHDGTLDVGTPPDLRQQTNNTNNKAAAVVKEEPMEMDHLLDDELNEQENANDAGELKSTDEPVLDTSTWTQQMDRLYFRTLQIFQEHYITRLVYENLPNGPVRTVTLLENTSLQVRHSFGNIAGWDNDILIWLHNLFTTQLPMHDHLITTYHEVMQYLSKRLPKLIDKFYPNPDRIPASVATTPITSAATTPVHPSSGGYAQNPGGRSRHSSVSQHPPPASNYLTLEEDPAAKFVLEGSRPMPRRLTSNPIILFVPSGPSIPSQPITARMEYWKTLLSSMGQLINVNIPYRPEQTATEILQVIKTSVRDKIRDTMKKKFNELRPLLLVGFNQGSLIAIHCALDQPGQVAAIICLGFPLTSLNGFRGDLDDPMLDLDIPILFVIGQMAATSTIGALERLLDKVVAVRDPYGFRPLVMGRRSNGAVVFASETCALDLIEAAYEREVLPGEVVVVDKEGVQSICLMPHPEPKSCIFEHIYFALPNSIVYGRSVYESRRAFGEILATEAPVDCDVVIAVPDSGVVAALGYAAKAGVPFQQGLIRSHYVGRTFIEPSQKIRDFGVKLKLSPVRAVLEGKRVVVVDDSIVRGTTSSKIVRLLKEAGAKEVHMRIASPPIIASCYYGVDTPSSEELISNRMSVEGIREYIGSDSLAFLPIESLNKLLGKDSNSFCYACFSGKYPVEPTGKVKRIGDFMDDGLSGDMDSIDGGWLPGSSKVQKTILNEVRTS